ncbi:hypothetical protein Daus18300_005444 [Diaporthe australafricana]|uniref:FAD-binding PCMH-type domain-containing protein n=1 Tax=Diaporthe australafricana TaxID=127596 RepID=A0ABR3X135_9PEZI
MAPIFANESCDPFTDRDAQCVVGSYVQYAVNATGASDYIATLAFAREQNIRLVIRNTGHDYLGKSTGAGALALWTHHLKDINVLDYSSPAYTGKAMRLGAGVQAFEAQAVANELGFVVVEGACPTVGIAGGYSQGGGAGPLGSKYGLAADQVLEWRVVTPSGAIITATPDQNSDMYWALTGGGGGTYGVVLSMTVKMHQDAPTAGATLSFTEASEKYWDAVQVFVMNLPAMVDAGVTVYWQVASGNRFFVPQSYFPNGTAQELERLLHPTLDALNSSGINFAFSSNDYDAYQDAFHSMNPDINITEMNIGGRLIPRSLVSSNDSAANLTSAIKEIVSNRGILAGVSENVGRPPTSPNSAHPYWRETLFLAFFGIFYDKSNLTANYVAQQTVTDVLVPALAKLTPNGAAYLNEANIQEPNWQETFYGSNYPRLLSIKKKYDPSEPCQNCATAGQACEYREVDRKRRPATHEYVASLENRVAWLESFIGRLQAAPGQERDSMLQSVSFGDHPPAPESSVATVRPTTGNDGGHKRESSANLQIDLEGSLIYHGATSIYRAHSGRPATGTAFGESSALSNQSVDSDTNFEYVAEHFRINLHDELVHDALLQFFKWQYPHFMFIYREAFLRDHFSDRISCKYWSSALLLSICALGTLMSPDKRNRESSAQFFSAAESILIVSGLTKPSIVTVQGFLCLAFYEIGRGNLSKGWGFSGMGPWLPAGFADCDGGIGTVNPLIPCFKEQIRLSKVVEKMLSKLFSTKSTLEGLGRQSCLDSLNIELCAWYETLPECAKWNKWEPPSTPLIPSVAALQ